MREGCADLRAECPGRSKLHKGGAAKVGEEQPHSDLCPAAKQHELNELLFGPWFGSLKRHKNWGSQLCHLSKELQGRLVGQDWA